MKSVRKVLLLACVPLILPMTLTISALRYELSPVPPRSQAVASAQAKIALDKSTVVPAPSPVKGIVALSHSAEVLEIVVAPTENQFLVVTEFGQDKYGEPDAFGGFLYEVRMDKVRPVAREIVSGNNIVSKPSAVWNPDGTAAYYEYDDGKCPPIANNSCGIFKLDAQTGKVEKVSSDSTQGLAISPDGNLLAFWDYTTDDGLTVFDLKRNAIVNSWAGEVHAVDDSLLSDIAFAPDGKSVFALTYAGNETPLKQFDLQTRKVRTVSGNARSLAGVKDSVYFLQFTAAIADSTPAISLMKIAPSDSSVEKVLDDFPYDTILVSGNGKWIVARGGDKGLAIYDTQGRALRTAGPQCQTAAVMPDDRVIYAVRGVLTTDLAAC